MVTLAGTERIHQQDDQAGQQQRQPWRELPQNEC
jgi:hypothetical protein